MNLGIIGNGVVGQATARAFMEFAQVRCYDSDPHKRTHTLEEVCNSQIVFLCLPTPCEGEQYDLSALDAVLESVPDGPLYVVKSTVGLGDTQALSFRYGHLDIVHSPEFLTQRCALTDAMIPSRNIVGRTVKDDGQELVELYEKRFPGVPCLRMKSEESELVKLACNAFFATKVTFFNLIHQTTKQRNLNYETVLRGMLSDGRIAHSHTGVPGPDGQLGFGGACLPKDTRSLLGSTRSSPTEPHLLATVLKVNRKYREGTYWIQRSA